MSPSLPRRRDDPSPLVEYYSISNGNHNPNTNVVTSLTVYSNKSHHVSATGCGRRLALFHDSANRSTADGNMVNKVAQRLYRSGTYFDMYLLCVHFQKQ